MANARNNRLIFVMTHPSKKNPRITIRAFTQQPRSRYDGARLRIIRAQHVNHKGEPRR